MWASSPYAGPLVMLDRSVIGHNHHLQKYGGSSLADAASIKRVARRITETKRAGSDVCVVVSAMGDTTDELLDLAQEVSPLPPPRELDMLMTAGERISMALVAMAISDLGFSARSFTGSQAGVITSAEHGKAKIIDVTPGRITEIYSDVDGVFTADPRIAPRASKLDRLSAEEMLELAAGGSKILHLRCVEYARRYNIPIHVRSTFTDKIGTIVVDPAEGETVEAPIIAGVAHDPGDAKVTVVGVPDRSGMAAAIFEAVARAGLNIDMIVQNVSAVETGLTDISFTLPKGDGKSALKALADGGVNVEMISTSEIRISVVTREERLAEAVRAVHSAFGLDSDSGEAVVYAGTGR